VWLAPRTSLRQEQLDQAARCAASAMRNGAANAHHPVGSGESSVAAARGSPPTSLQSMNRAGSRLKIGCPNYAVLEGLSIWHLPAVEQVHSDTNIAPSRPDYIAPEARFRPSEPKR
jgi:hypothetical protein